MKTCTVCNTGKDESEFFVRDKTTGRLHSQCKTCKREIDLKYYHENSTGRSSRIRKRAIENVHYVRSFIQRVKRFAKCRGCGDFRWYVLDFHHVRGKDINLSVIARNYPSIKNVKEEMRKCIFLCSNCHREVHYLKSLGPEANLVKATD